MEEGEKLTYSLKLPLSSFSLAPVVFVCTPFLHLHPPSLSYPFFPSQEDKRLRISEEKLKEKIEKDIEKGNRPFLVISSLGDGRSGLWVWVWVWVVGYFFKLLYLTKLLTLSPFLFFLSDNLSALADLCAEVFFFCSIDFVFNEIY